MLTDRIRKADKKDIEAVFAVYRSVIGSDGCSWGEEYPTLQDVADDAERDALYVLCDENDEILGAAASGTDEELDELPCWSRAILNPCSLSRLGVRLDCQGKGLAKKLVRHVEKEALRQGFDGVHFLASVDNPRALALYEGLGYIGVGETDMWGLRWRCYEKPLS